jgi:diguanylate cyclase (GGDEF)-like protein
MSLRVKFVVALLATSLMSVLLMWAVAEERMSRRFDDLVQARSARNFRGDVAAYWLTYGSWDAGVRAEPFIRFVTRRKAILGASSAVPDTGDASEARALPPLSTGSVATRDAQDAAAPRRSPGGSGSGSGDLGGPRPPFRFLLFDPAGRVLNPVGPGYPPNREVTAEERARAIPVRVAGQVVAFASPIGTANYTDIDRAYLGAMHNALIWGIAAAGVMAVGLGLLAGRHLSRSLRRLTDAISGMQEGALRQHVEITSRDEVGVLAAAFNRMSDALARSHEELQSSHHTISEQAEQLRIMAERDPLTQLYNRRYFDAVAAALYEQSARYDRALSVAIADVDLFKQVNDRFSHATGDAVLKVVSSLLRGRSSDVAARYGGEEFVIAFPETALAEATDYCEHLRARIETHPWHEIHPDLRVTVSLGICDDRALGSLEGMLKAADARLYRAKAAGRNRVCHEGEVSVA